MTYRVDLALQAEAVLFTAASFAVFSRLVPAGRLGPYRGGYFEFAVVGVAVTQLVSASLRAFSDAVSREQQEGTFEVLLTGATRFRLVIGGGALVPLGLAVAEVVLILVAGLLVFGHGMSVGGAVLAIPVIAASVAGFGAIGIVSAAFVLLFKRGDPISAVFASMSALVGGALFPVSVMPNWLQVAAHVLPPYYAIDGLRGALLGGVPVGRVLADTAALTGFAVAAAPLAWWCVDRSLAVARRAGTLGTY